MLTLIKREIEDAIVFFVIAAIFMAILVSVLVYKVATGWESNQAFGVPLIMYKTLVSFPFLFLPLIAAVLGVSQMRKDKDRKTSALLATLATTRRRILSAKIITGFLWILLAVLPVAAADVVLLKIFTVTPVPDAVFLRNVFIAVFLYSLACYAFGLQIGWRAKKIFPALGVIFVTPVLVSLIVIKGFGFETMVVLSLFTIAAVIRTWQKFMSAPL